MPYSDALMRYRGRKHCVKRRNCLNQAISPFHTMFSTLYCSYFLFWMHFKMSSAIFFNLDQFKKLSSGNGLNPCIFVFKTRLGGSVVSVSDSWPGGCEFDPRLRRLFFLAYFRLSPLQKHVRKVVGGFERKVVLALVWESQETHMRHRPPWYDLSC